MKGYQITFFTQQDHMHRNKPAAEWLMHAARELGVRGATVISGTEGYGKHRKIHSARFFELADQPQEVLMAMSEEEAVRLFAFLEQEGIHLFYVKSVVEYGTLGEPDQ